MSKINATTTGIQNIGDTTPDIEFQSGGVTKAVMKSDGRLYGLAIHNNAGDVTGTTNQYIASGTYTPTLFNTTNVSASTAFVSQWIRVGNVVTVSGQVAIDRTSAPAATELGMSLPIASALTLQEQAGGTAIDSSGYGMAILADATNNRVYFLESTCPIATNDFYGFHFTYLIV